MHKLILASAGAGKSQLIAEQALEQASKNKTSLILTYTENNQQEILNKICHLNGYKPSNITIKGWFTFLLEDMIRPYQKCIFPDRISGIYFNKEGDPHKRNGKSIPGTAECRNGVYNPVHYLTKSYDKAHTTYLSKLAAKVHKETEEKTTNRLYEIYDTIFIDETQDLVGWDFEIITAMAKNKAVPFLCVGDFRQTIYSTHPTTKHPKTNAQKLEKFKAIEFEFDPLNTSWRCIQEICDFADLVHADENFYQPTISKVENIPDEFKDHQGIFVVSQSNVDEYIKRYSPIILRTNRATQIDLCKNHRTYNFGEAKGLGFNRTLILPTDKHESFLKGATNVFDADKTGKAKNTLYVAITRARYSTAFLYDGNDFTQKIKRWAV